MCQIFNLNHFKKVREARTQAGMRVERTKPFQDDNLIGQSVMDVYTDRIYKIKTMNQYWYDGWVITAILQDESSLERKVIWDNINSSSVEEADLMKNYFQMLRS